MRKFFKTQPKPELTKLVNGNTFIKGEVYRVRRTGFSNLKILTDSIYHYFIYEGEQINKETGISEEIFYEFNGNTKEEASVKRIVGFKAVIFAYDNIISTQLEHVGYTGGFSADVKF
jgi:hypothetical protein